MRAATDLVNSPDQVHVSGDIRLPPVAPKQPPLVFHPSHQENAQATEMPSDYQSDWFAFWRNSDWKRNDYRHRSK